MKTTKTDRPSYQPPTLWPMLHVLYSGDRGVVGMPHLLPVGAAMMIGRGIPAGEGLPLPDDPLATRHHARIDVQPGRAAGVDGCRFSVTLQDLNSKNGTFVNGRRVSECPLAEGDLIRIGSSFLSFRLEKVVPQDEDDDDDDDGDDDAASLAGGLSQSMRQLDRRLRQLAPLDEPVLLLGESGSGKEVAARKIHEYSGRSGEFIAINCAEISSELAESQLFGHVHGSFTGARSTHTGFFRAAQNGTLFLDEIGEFHPGLQPKLLRTLQEREVTPVGATRPIPCDVRVIAATHRNLPREVESGTFRGDLYQRLARLLIHVPPLREHREDLLPLLMSQLAPATPQLSTSLVEALLLYAWPYNIRELFNIAAGLKLAAANQTVLELEALEGRLGEGAALPSALPDRGAEVPAREDLSGPRLAPRQRGIPLSREELSRYLSLHKGNLSTTATAVGRSRREISRWMRTYKLDRKDFMS